MTVRKTIHLSLDAAAGNPYIGKGLTFEGKEKYVGHACTVTPQVLSQSHLKG